MNYSYDTASPEDRVICDVMQNHVDSIIQRWQEAEFVQMVCKEFEFDKSYFEMVIAAPVLRYFISIFEHQSHQEESNFPLMRRLVDEFYTRGLSVEHIFTFCTALKNSVIVEVLLHNESLECMTRIMKVFDANLTRILMLYSDKLRKNDAMLSTYGKIIEDHVVLSVTDKQGIVTHVSNAFCELTGFKREEWIGKTHAIIKHPDMPEAIFTRMWETITQGKEFKITMKNIKRNGKTFVAKTRIVPSKDADGKIVEYLAIREDITDKELMNYDPLTKIYNRRMFDKLFSELMQQSMVNASPLSLLIIDIDHFKSVNDRFGHQEGDNALIRISKIITKNLRQNDSCSRWGGEEFVVLLPNSDHLQGQLIAERIRISVERNLKVHNEVLTCSIGVAVLQNDDTETTLFERADKALYQAKSSGRNRISFL
jgi:diguanylate cyclase (GGDEF)-like protein/PAS domain S-box-containing protein